MKKILLILSCLLIQNCNKPKTVLFCGDHVCVNKAEAKQYFEENLSIEVKILDKKKINNIDLVELNLNSNTNNKRQVSIKKKDKTNNPIKVLTNEEVKKIKIDINKKNNKKKLIKKIKTKTDDIKKNSIKNRNKNSKVTQKKIVNIKKSNKKNEIANICSIIEKCNIDEISKFLIQQGKKKDFPDITTRE